MIRSLCIFLILICAAYSYGQELDDAQLAEAIKQSANSRNTPQKVRALKVIADHYYETDQYQLASLYYDSCLILGTQIPDQRKDILYKQSFSLLAVGEHFQSLNVLNDLIPSLVTKQDSTSLCKCLERKGYNFVKLSSLDSSAYYFLQSLQCAEDIGDRKSVISELNNLSNVLLRMEDDEKAMTYLMRAHQLSVEWKDTAMIATISSNLAIQYYYQSKLDTAMKYARISLLLAKSNERYLQLSNAYLRMALVNLGQKNFKTAINYADSALAIQDVPDALKVTALKYKAEASLKLNELDIAYKNINEAIEIGNRGKDLDVVFILYKIASEILEARGMHASALSSYKKYSILKDSALNMDKIEKIEDLMTLYETEKKTREIESLSNRSKLQEVKIQQKNLMIVGGAVLFVILISLILLFYRQRNLRRQNELLSLQQRLLRSQMNPHFIFNALSAIQNFILKNNAIEGASFISKFGNLMRQFLEQSRLNFISLEEEISTLTNYLTVQQLRFEGKFEFEIHVGDGIELKSTFLPPLLAQPFIENSIEHGLSERTSGGRIDVFFSRQGEAILLKVIDNGKGLSEAKNGTHQSLSTSITRERLRNINGSTESSNLTIKNRIDSAGEIAGVAVSLIVPIRKTK
ncbi:MAG: histidine kinase [Cytophagales bacterium]